MRSSIQLVFAFISQNRTEPSSSIRNSSALSTTLSSSSSLSVGYREEYEERDKGRAEGTVCSHKLNL